LTGEFYNNWCGSWVSNNQVVRRLQTTEKGKRHRDWRTNHRNRHTNYRPEHTGTGPGPI